MAVCELRPLVLLMPVGAGAPAPSSPARSISAAIARVITPASCAPKSGESCDSSTLAVQRVTSVRAVKVRAANVGFAALMDAFSVCHEAVGSAVTALCTCVLAVMLTVRMPAVLSTDCARMRSIHCAWYSAGISTPVLVVTICFISRA